MPSSLLTADETGRVYLFPDVSRGLSTGSSGVILGSGSMSACTLPDSLDTLFRPYSSPSKLFIFQVNI